jgi:YD repeat-containing protein
MKRVWLLPLLLCAALARAETPPLDPWTEPAWQDVLYGLPRGQVSRVSATQQLFNPLSAAGEAISTRDVQFEFDAPDGRVGSLVEKQERRGEAGSLRRLRYVYDAGRLQRIDEDGQATPALTRRYDAAGRPVEQTERTGAVIARTTWRYDAAGRPIERVADSGTGSRLRERWRYRADGTLEQRQQDSGRLLGTTIEFDAQERPVRIRVTDALDRHETAIVYPSPTEAVHTTSGFALARDGAGRYEHTTHYRVRTPQELRRIEAPALPTLRRQVRGTQHSETRTEYDAAGRIVTEREIDAAGQPVCTVRMTHHASGPPLTVRREAAQGTAAPCGVQGGDLDNEVRADARGHWVEQRMTMVRPDGQRRPMSVQTRVIDYRP